MYHVLPKMHYHDDLKYSLHKKLRYSKFFCCICQEIRSRKPPNTETFHIVTVVHYTFMSKLNLIMHIENAEYMVAVTSNSLAKRSSFRESSFVPTQANYRKFQRTVKRKWNKSIFLIQIYKFPFIFYFQFLWNMKMKCWYFDSRLTTWDYNRNYCSFFMFKNILVSKRGDVKS